MASSNGLSGSCRPCPVDPLPAVTNSRGTLLPLRRDSRSFLRRSTLHDMTQIAATYEAEWAARTSQSLAGQTATVIQRDGTRKAIRLGADVHLRPEGGRPGGPASVLRPIVEGHVAASEAEFDVEDQDLVLGDGSVFRISFSHGTFFFAIAPLASRLQMAGVV